MALAAWPFSRRTSFEVMLTVRVAVPSVPGGGCSLRARWRLRPPCQVAAAAPAHWVPKWFDYQHQQQAT